MLSAFGNSNLIYPQNLFYATALATIVTIATKIGDKFGAITVVAKLATCSSLAKVFALFGNKYFCLAI